MAPNTLLLMRHAEKPDDPANPSLSASGAARAQWLPEWVSAVLKRAPDVILAAAVSKHSARSYETVKPLSKATGVPIDATYADADYPALAATLLGKVRYDDKLIVVCWHHGQIPPFARALGAPPGHLPDPWPDDVFDLVLKFKFPARAPVEVTTLRETFGQA